MTYLLPIKVDEVRVVAFLVTEYDQKTNILKTISVLLFRVLVWLWLGKNCNKVVVQT
jgi:hypothetical protein